MYEEVIKEFEDKINIKDIFKSFSFNFAYSQLNDAKNNLKFLIGIPGTGKSFLIDYFYNKQNKDNIILLKGVISKEELDSVLEKDKLIIIDEAQILDKKLIEYIRILSDTKNYSFILSMHTHDARTILDKEHFKSRSIDIIEINTISKAEMIQYINQKLLKANANHLLSKNEFNTIFKYTKGNFRYIKKFIKTLFELLEFASNNNLDKYKKINRCLITMSAIKLGLENG